MQPPSTLYIHFCHLLIRFSAVFYCTFSVISSYHHWSSNYIYISVYMVICISSLPLVQSGGGRREVAGLLEKDNRSYLLSARR